MHEFWAQIEELELLRQQTSGGGYFERQICELKSRNKASLRFVKGVDRYAVRTSFRQEQMSAAAFRQFPFAHRNQYLLCNTHRFQGDGAI